MKKSSLLLLAVCSAMAAPAAAFGGWNSEPMISVTGSAEIKLPPDEIFINLGVESRDKVLDTAKTHNDRKVAAVLVFLSSAGVEKKDVSTDFIGIRPEFTHDDRVTPSHYIAQRSIGVRIRKEILGRKRAE